ncbi:hypothetical protein OUZ56_026129 [Daphnia magna]|uniref:Uncharacterized protein n=1 Tax=Daphnia magna TaxID=35525 RepID=A0ABQ9ZKW5_9CRUS|nr:hypothetical protein OUZ56_026129 [Daphnia magna]
MADYCNDVIDEFLEDMGNLTDNFDDLSTGSDNELRAENRRAKKRRLIPFYRTRKDILSYFSADKLMATFRHLKFVCNHEKNFEQRPLPLAELPISSQFSLSSSRRSEYDPWKNLKYKTKLLRLRIKVYQILQLELGISI